MCELDVYLTRQDSNAKVASEIIYAATEHGTLVIRDIVGSTKKFEGSIISGIDINHERMQLKESPILATVLDFISVYEECLSKGTYDAGLQDHWEEVKARGDQMVRDLWAKSKKAEAT
jgi:predicted RNA-binding protein